MMPLMPRNIDFNVFISLMDTSIDEFLIYDHNYNLLYINKDCERHYGFSQEEMLSFFLR